MPRTPMPPRPFIPAQGVMQAEMIYSFLGQVAENVYHVLQGDGATAPTAAQMEALAAGLESWESAEGSHRRSDAVALTAIRVRDLSVEGGPVIEHTPAAPIAGLRTEQVLPGNVTYAVKWGTALGGRSFRGRTFHIGLVANQISGDQLASGVGADAVLCYNALRTAIAGVSGCTFVVLSYAHNNAWRTAAVHTPIIGCSVNNDLDSQRRRLAGRGA